MNNHRVALITGSSSGIGAAIARRFTEEGMRVVVNSATSTAAGEKLAAELPEAIYVQADVADAADARRLVDAAVAAYGRLDVLVNNAGITRYIHHADLQAADADAWRAIFDVNVLGTWQVTTAAVPHLRASGSGVIVNISSLAGDLAAGSSIPYAVSKAAVNHMTRLLAAALGPEIRVNAVSPGHIETPWHDGAPEDLRDSDDWTKAHTPLRRVGTPEDVAEAALALVKVTYTTGDILTVDGGRHLV
jgi:ketoreductase RED2